MVCNFVKCNNVNELKELFDFGTVGLPYVDAWTFDKYIFPVYANISFEADFGVVLNDICSSRPASHMANIIDYNDFKTMVSAVLHQKSDSGKYDIIVVSLKSAADGVYKFC